MSYVMQGIEATGLNKPYLCLPEDYTSVRNKDK